MKLKQVSWRFRDPRLVIVTAGVTLMIVVTALAVFQSPTVAAPPPPLKGPFRFIKVPDMGSAAAAAPTAQWTPFYTETFDAPISSKPGWQLTVTTALTDTPSQLKWEYVAQSSNSSGAFTSTLWSSAFQVGRITNYVVTSTSSYSPWMNTWAIYALDPQKYARFKVAFDFWLDTDPGAQFGWAVSCDGTNFYGPSPLSGHARTWIHGAPEPAGCPGQAGAPAYVAFFFQSDGSAPVGLGAFVDNLVVYGLPWYKTYMPLVRRDPTPTPTPTPTVIPYVLVQTYDFESDYQGWCQHTDYVDNWLAQRVYVDSSNAYRVGVNTSDLVAMTSPHYNPPSDYRIKANFSLRDMTSFNLNSYNGAKWGLIFGVNSTPFDPDDPDHCGYAPNVGGYYKFTIKIKDDGSGYQTKLERWDGGGNTQLVGLTDLPSGVSISQTDWSTITLDRNGSGIVVYINGIQVLNTSDGTWTGSRWWGVFAEEPSGYSDNQPFETNWDNIQIYDLTP